MRPAFVPILIALILPLTVLACGDDDESATSEEPAAAETATPDPTPTAAADEGAETVVNVSLGEWFVRPETAEAQAGTIEFEAVNDGQAPHELEVVKTDTAADAFPVSGERAEVEKVGEESGGVQDIAAGATKSLTVELEAGTYVLICNLPTHYEQGMTGALTVK